MGQLVHSSLQLEHSMRVPEHSTMVLVCSSRHDETFGTGDAAVRGEACSMGHSKDLEHSMTVQGHSRLVLEHSKPVVVHSRQEQEHSTMVLVHSMMALEHNSSVRNSCCCGETVRTDQLQQIEGQQQHSSPQLPEEKRHFAFRWFSEGRRLR